MATVFPASVSLDVYLSAFSRSFPYIVGSPHTWDFFLFLVGHVDSVDVSTTSPSFKFRDSQDSSSHLPQAFFVSSSFLHLLSFPCVSGAWDNLSTRRARFLWTSRGPLGQPRRAVAERPALPALLWRPLLSWRINLASASQPSDSAAQMSLRSVTLATDCP